MSSKKKLIVSLGVVAAVVLAAVIAVVAVLAATTQAVTSNITVQYNAGKSVAGYAKANYYLGTSEDKNVMTNNGKAYVEADKNDTVWFLAGESAPAATKVLSPVGNIELFADDAQDYVVFEYVFFNNGDYAYTALIDTDSESENYTITYAATLTTNTSWEDEPTAVTVDAANETGVKYYVKIELNDDAKGRTSSFTADFAWTLTALDNQA